MDMALSDIRVLDLTHGIAGPLLHKDAGRLRRGRGQG